MEDDDVDEFEAYDFSEFTEDDLAQIDADIAAHAGPAIQIKSPFQTFLAHKKCLSVTDLVAPLWCEVQHEYNLYGKHHKPLHLRPSAFTSRSGKQIRVLAQEAHANDRRLKRGKSVHKALEVELSPDKLIVRPVSEEERFGLRLLQLIDGFNQLISTGITRELPVFTITHAQVVLGIIDEVLLNQVRSPEFPMPPRSPLRKKQRLTSPPTQQQISAEPTREPTETALWHELRILDYKTRRSLTIPSDQDSLSARIQLMMYHRMLSTLLQPDAFDFDLLWSRLSLDPTKPFSVQFLKDVLWEHRQVDSLDCNVHLNRLVSDWISTVRRNPVRVSQQLQVVYRRSVLVGKHQKKGKERATKTVDVDDPLGALVVEEELNIARAIEESLSGMRNQEAVQVGPSSLDCTSVDTGQADPMLIRAIQQSLFDCARKTCAGNDGTEHDDPPLDERKSDQAREGAILEISPVIGTKEFEMNDDELDARLGDVLQWWFGERRARGVDINQTNRCSTCEYRDSCEWREEKATERLR